MTNKNLFKKSKSKLFSVLLLCLVCILSFSTAIACSEDDPDAPNYNPSFEYTEYLKEAESKSLIKNPNFTQGLKEVKDDEYPVSSMTGWTISTDTGASTSAVTSGVINVENGAWEKAIKKLAGDTDFVDWAKATLDGNGIATNDSTDQIATKIKAKLDNPGKSTGAEDNNVLMLNNISAKSKVEKYGTAQSAISASQITLEAGEQACISVWVKTDKNLASINANFGANIRLTTTVNEVTQAQYAVKNIITDGEWVKYNIYVNGNEYLPSTITVALGLGFGEKSGDASQYAYGIAYFDNLKVEKIEDYSDKVDATYEKSFSKSVEAYNGNPDEYRISATSGVTDYFYNLSFDFRSLRTAGGVFANTTPVNINEYTSFAPYDKLGLFSSGTITVNKQVHGAQIGEFTVENEGFAVVSFKLKNELNKYYKDGVKVYVEDIATGAKSQKSLLFTDNNNDGEETVYTITINNNFPVETNPADPDRQFRILIVVGPQNPTEQTSNTFYPTGTVTISDALVYQSAEGGIESKKNADKFLEGLSSGSYENFVSYNLHAGYTNDYSETTETANYSIKVSGVNKYNIATEVVNPSEYKGVTPNHKLVKVSENGEELDTKVNDHKNGTAGVINSEFLSLYSTALPNIANLVENTNGKDEHTQSLVIYNSTASSYGFIGATKTISSNSTVKVTLKVKTSENTTAYIYLVDMGSDNKLDVLSHKVGETSNNLMLEIDTKGEWKEVTFNVAAGASAINYRLEIWNGSRDGAVKNTGYVIVEDIAFGTFTEATSKNDIYGADKTNALAEAYKNYVIEKDDIDAGIVHTRELTDLENQFNEEYKDDKTVEKIKYDPKYVWVKTEGAFVYAIYNTIDPVTTNPYDNIETEEEPEEEKSGCDADFNAGTFWLQFSTIALAVLLLGAVLILIIRTFRRRHKKAVKVKSRYSVRSRNVTNKVDDVKVDNTTENYDASVEDFAEEETDADDTEYTYGEVLEDFGDDVVIDGQTVEIETAEETETVEEVPATETEDVSSEEPSSDNE